MDWQRTVIWRGLSWGWVGLPILAFVPGIPTRLAVQWISLACSLVVLAVGLALPRGHGHGQVFGWALLGCLGVVPPHWRQMTPMFLWVCHAGLLLTAAGMLTHHAESRWLRQAVVWGAWGQVVVLGLQVLHVPLPWPLLANPQHPPGGTVGALAPAAALVGLGSFWSSGWRAWALGVATCLTGSGTAIPLVVLRLLWPWRWLRWGMLLLLPIGLWWGWRDAFLERWAIWSGMPWMWWGRGFRAFPGGFQDDTLIGRAMQWRDTHNVYLDWVGRFGLPGIVVLGGVLWWCWKQSRTVEQRWLLAFSCWVACWQSLEQFPVLMIPVMVWWISVSQSAGGVHAVHPI